MIKALSSFIGNMQWCHQKLTEWWMLFYSMWDWRIGQLTLSLCWLYPTPTQSQFFSLDQERGLQWCFPHAIALIFGCSHVIPTLGLPGPLWGFILLWLSQPTHLDSVCGGWGGGMGSGSAAGNRLQKADYLRGHPRSPEIPRAVGHKTRQVSLY